MCDKHTIDGVMASLPAGSNSAVAPPAALTGDDNVHVAVVHVTSFSHVVDLTHRLTPDFPSYFGKAFDIEQVRGRADGGFLLQWLSHAEHVGTHFDAPLHFREDGAGIDEIPVGKLVCPLVVIEVREQVARDEDYRLSLADIERFEARHGCIPDHACVAMYSGWEERLGSAGFENIDASGVYHFPGFHEDAVAFLLNEREVSGIAVDTLSLDFGATRSNPVHNLWLPSGRYGIENVANLGHVPPMGATIFAGAPKFQRTTGGPGRVLAVF